MPAASNHDDTLKSQMVYYKIPKDVEITKGLLNSLDLLRFKITPGDPIAKMKRAGFCGRDKKQYRMVDLLQGLTDAEIDGLTVCLTPSQSDSFL